MYLMASPTVWIFSASSSGMFRSNSSSNSITSSTVSRLSADRSLMKEVCSVTFSFEAPICSQTISITRSRTLPVLATLPPAGRAGALNGASTRGPCFPRGSVPPPGGSPGAGTLLHDHAAVYANHLPGNVPRPGGGEELHQRDDVGRGPEPPEGDPGLQSLGGPRWQSGRHVGFDVARRDRVGRDAPP